MYTFKHCSTILILFIANILVGQNTTADSDKKSTGQDMYTSSNIPLIVGDSDLQPHPSAQLEVQSNNKGLLIPRMDFCDILHISNPAEGLMIYDTEFHCLRIYINGHWDCLYQNRNHGEDTGNLTAWPHVMNYGEDYHIGISVDGYGNVYALSELLDNDLDFVRKYSKKGELIWEIEIKMSGYMVDIEVNEQGNIIIVGYKSYGVEIGSFVATPNQSKSWVATLNPDNGSVIQFNLLDDDALYVAALREDGEFYLGGNNGLIKIFDSNATLLSIIDNEDPIADIQTDFLGNIIVSSTAADKSNVNITKYDEEGVFIAANNIGSLDEIRSSHIAKDINNEVYLLVVYKTSFRHGNPTAGYSTFGFTDNYGVGIIKFDQSLSITSTTSFEHDEKYISLEMDLDHDKILFIAGGTESSIKVDEKTYNSSQGRRFIMKYDASASLNFLGVKQFFSYYTNQNFIDVYPGDQAYTIATPIKGVKVGNVLIDETKSRHAIVKYYNK